MAIQWLDSHSSLYKILHIHATPTFRITNYQSVEPEL